MRQVHFDAEFIDANAAYAFGAAQTMRADTETVRRRPLPRNIMKQAANIKDLELPMLLPGITINTSPTNFSPIRQMQLAPSTVRAGSFSASS